MSVSIVIVHAGDELPHRFTFTSTWTRVVFVARKP